MTATTFYTDDGDRRTAVAGCAQNLVKSAAQIEERVTSLSSSVSAPKAVRFEVFEKADEASMLPWCRSSSRPYFVTDHESHYTNRA